MGSYDWIAAVYGKTAFTAFDTETTGIKHDTERVVEIGCVKFDLKGIISRYTVLINPEKPMPAEASAVNNITDEMLAGKPVFKEIVHDFLRFIKDTVLVAHNAPFDINFINSELKRCGFGPMTNKVFDTLVFAREVYPGFESYALQNLAARFNIDTVSAHRADDDARVCMEFFNKAVKHFIEVNKEMIPHFTNGINVEDYIKTQNPEKIEENIARNLF